MNELQRSLAGYYREIRSWLPCSGKQKDLILSRFRDSVQAYLEDHPTADFAQIRRRFGNPDEIAGSYVEEMGTLELLRIMRIRRRIVAIVAGTAAVILLTWLGVIGWAIAKEISYSNGHIIDEIGYPEQIISTSEGD